MIVTLQHKLPAMPQTKRDHRFHGLALIYGLALATLLAACNDSGKPGTAGNTEAHPQVTPQHDEFLQIAEKLEQSQNPFLGREQIALLERKLGNPRLPMAAVAQLQNQLWQHYLRVGDLDNARQSKPNSMRSNDYDLCSSVRQ